MTPIISNPPRLQPDKYTIVHPTPKRTPTVITFKKTLLKLIVIFKHSVRYIIKVYTTAPIIDGIVSFSPKQIIPVVTSNKFPTSNTYEVFISNK